MEGSTDEGAPRGGHPQEQARHSMPGRPEHVPGCEPGHWLQRTIELEIIPRLMLAHRGDSRAPEVAEAPQGVHGVAGADVEAFTLLVLRDDQDACSEFVGALSERGVPVEQILLGLLAPAARRLGRLWEADRCDFAQVTLSLWRLQTLVMDLSPEVGSAPLGVPEQPRRALLAAAPGSQHTLGLLMVAEFFRRAGWEVWSDPCASEGDLAALVRSEWFDLVGLSIGSDGHVSPLRSVILALRRASRNPDVGVMVGGAIFADRPGLVDEVGADFTAADAQDAIERAEAFVATRTLSS
jgi:methanogenic corrinoid protein MtbC1